MRTTLVTVEHDLPEVDHPGNAAVELLRLPQLLGVVCSKLDDERGRVKVLQKLGTVYGDHLSDPAAAATAWKRVLEIDPKNGRATRTLRESQLPEDVAWEDVMMIMEQQITHLVNHLGEMVVNKLTGVLVATDDGGFIEEFIKIRQQVTA